MSNISLLLHKCGKDNEWVVKRGEDGVAFFTSYDDACLFYNTLTNTPASSSASEGDLDEIAIKMGDAISKIIEQGVQETDGQYPSAKNNKCVHDRFGFEGCESCIEEYLMPFYKEYKALTSQAKPQDVGV